jgi:hypothetical protein
MGSPKPGRKALMLRRPADATYTPAQPKGGFVLRRYVATYEYTRIVAGEPREFVHQTTIEAVDGDSANELAFRHFDELDRQTGAGWSRVLNRCEVSEAPRDAVIEVGTPGYGELSVEE